MSKIEKDIQTHKECLDCFVKKIQSIIPDLMLSTGTSLDRPLKRFLNKKIDRMWKDWVFEMSDLATTPSSLDKFYTQALSHIRDKYFHWLVDSATNDAIVEYVFFESIKSKSQLAAKAVDGDILGFNQPGIGLMREDVGDKIEYVAETHVASINVPGQRMQKYKIEIRGNHIYIASISKNT